MMAGGGGKGGAPFQAKKEGDTVRGKSLLRVAQIGGFFPPRRKDRLVTLCALLRSPLRFSHNTYARFSSLRNANAGGGQISTFCFIGVPIPLAAYAGKNKQLRDSARKTNNTGKPCEQNITFPILDDRRTKHAPSLVSRSKIPGMQCDGCSASHVSITQRKTPQH